MNSEFIPLIVVVPLAAAVLANLLHGKKRLLKYFTLLFALAMLSLPIITPYGEHIFGGHISERYNIGLATGIEYVFTQHQQIIIFTLFLIFLMSVLTYTSAYEHLSGPYLGFMILGISATSAVVMADDFFNLYVFMEIALLSQTALAIANKSIDSMKASLKYLMVANLAGNCLLIGIALLLSQTGSVNLSDIREYVATAGPELYSNPVFLSAAALVLFSWLYGSGLFPFHNIKSELYASAKPHASALMQTQTKFVLIALGIIILKLFNGLPAVRPLMLFGACLAMIFGVIMALKQDNYQRMLSYHAISQAGYVAAGIALGTPAAIVAGIFHALNHVLYKSALFLGCEVVHGMNKTSNFKSLGGAIYSIPYIGVLMLGAKFAISGIPPFNGFQSKLMLMTSAFDAGFWEVTVVMILVSVLTFISMMKAFHLAFMRPKQNMVEYKKPHITYTIALAILVGLCLLLGLYPSLATDYITGIAAEIGVGW
ncbi:MAG: energy conserving hydrogenase EhbF [Candidatus Altiarchaeota archaeon]|nr:energy conserving hydrogenase EhbF [Candidatus Altiarchaeota archaeon]